MKPTLRTAALLVGLMGMGVICFSCTPPHDPVDRAMEEIPIGTQRSEAIRLLDDAKCHLECWRPSGAVEDLFFYETCNPDSGTVVIVGSEPISGTMQVYQIGTFEDYALHVWYDWCLEEQLPDQDQQ